jgi:hypothetical protein
MKKMMCCAAALLALVLSGCSTLTNKAGELLDGRALAEKERSLYRTAGKGERIVEVRLVRLRSGEEVLAVTDSVLPGLEFRGTLPGGDGGFELTEAVFLSSHAQGWNEFTLGLIGSGVFSARDDAAELDFDGPPERVQISRGGIRLRSSRISGEEALAALKNRRERILALTEWMREGYAGTEGVPAFKDQDEFEKFWKPRLFPELVSKRKRPPEWETGNAEGTSVSWVRGDGVRWNSIYTEAVFPENLREFRNSGAMLRDWEEALAWIYLEYSWDSIAASFRGIPLMRVLR